MPENTELVPNYHDLYHDAGAIIVVPNPNLTGIWDRVVLTTPIHGGYLSRSGLRMVPKRIPADSRQAVRFGTLVNWLVHNRNPWKKELKEVLIISKEYSNIGDIRTLTDIEIEGIVDLEKLYELLKTWPEATLYHTRSLEYRLVRKADLIRNPKEKVFFRPSPKNS